jgi:hypothetical protein
MVSTQGHLHFRLGWVYIRSSRHNLDQGIEHLRKADRLFSELKRLANESAYSEIEDQHQEVLSKLA